MSKVLFKYMMKQSRLISLAIITPCILVQCGTSDKDDPLMNRPNILIAIGDDISFPHMGAYGCTWVKTPGFDRVARDGILFRNAYTPNAKSSPSRACLLTGRNSWQLDEAANHVPFFPARFTTFIESLGDHGYTAGYTAKGWAPGTALDSAGNPRELTGRAFNVKKTIPPALGIANSDYAANFEEFLNTKDPGKPFCFWYGSHEPHRKYQHGSGVAIGGKNLSDIDHVPGFWPDNDIVRHDMLDYALEIEYFDSHLVKMLDILEKRGELRNTIVIVTADNGMPFPRVKGQAYEYSNHMPLAIMWGKGIRNPGRTLYDYISFIDIAPTLLEAAGIEESESGMQPVEGKSMARLLGSRKRGLADKSRNHVLIGKERHDVGRPDDTGYPIRGIVKEGYLFLVNFKPNRWPSGDPETGYMDCDASPVKSLVLDLRRTRQSYDFWKLSFGKRAEEELYNISADPGCLINLASDPGLNPLKHRMREQMVRELGQQGDPRILGNGDVFDKYPYSSETVRDFYNRFMKGEVTRRSAGWIDSTDFEEES
ncbi:MAG: heparan N-sulfatase, partial [Bacteroidetes bacterium RBG_13_42_15]